MPAIDIGTTEEDCVESKIAYFVVGVKCNGKAPGQSKRSAESFLNRNLRNQSADSGFL